MAYDLLSGKQTARDWSCGASFFTSTDDVVAKLDSLTADVNNLNTDVSRWWQGAQKTPETKDFVNAWSRWRDATYRFIKSWREKSLTIKMAWTYADIADEKMRELAEWRGKYQELSGRAATAPASRPPAAPKPGDSSSAWKWVAAIAAGGAAFALISRKL